MSPLSPTRARDRHARRRRPGSLRWLPALALPACLLLFAARPAAAQVADSTLARPDSARTIPPAPSARPAPPRTAPASELKEPVRFSARDSLVVRFEDERDVGVLYGESKVTYSDALLEAYRIEILFDKSELHASGLAADTGLVGKPQIRQGSETFQGRELAFNLETERGRVVGAQTQIEDGFVRAGVAKVREDDVIFIKDGAYTTCSCVDDPSYSLRSSKMKIVDKKWIYTGPLQLYIYNIPTPLWLPFGFLPAQTGRRSGPLPPQYGEDEFGFYLRDWGWYFALSDYMDLQLKGSFWTKGSWGVSSLYRYSKRYAFNGQLQLQYSRLRRGESGDPDFAIENRGSFRWNHNQTISPTANFSANVNLTSSSYLRTFAINYDDRVRQTVQSTVRYSKRWPAGGRSLNLSLNQRQVFATGEVSLTLPNLTFSQNSKKPFRRKNRGAGEREQWYELITYSYSMSLNNNFNFRPLSDTTGISWFDALLSPSKYREATGQDEPFDFKTSHRVPVSATFTMTRLPVLGAFRMNLSPFFNYQEDWFIRTTRQAFSDSLNTIVRSSTPGFFSLRQFNLGISANTTFYGIFPVGVGPYSGIRHTVRPSLSFNFQPDFFDPSWGYTRSFVNAQGEEQRYAIVNGVRSGLQKALSFSLSNTFETKRIDADSTGEDRSRTLKLFNLDFSSSYNFAADSLKMSPISMRGRTRLFGQVDLDFSTSFSPYKIDADGRLLNEYVFDLRALDFARLTSLSLTARTSIRSKNRDGRSRPAAPPRAGFSPNPLDSQNPFLQSFTRTGGDRQADFAIPWSLNLDFTYGVSKPGLTTTKRAILNLNADFNLTPNWKVQARSGYDFERKELATTNLAILRDWECWQMSFNWIPFGDFQSWGFDLHVKSGHLRDLLRIRQPKSDIKDRFGTLIR
ncbi:putative LPS assembly protein LptD [Rhodocaloribacter sp.]